MKKETTPLIVAADKSIQQNGKQSTSYYRFGVGAVVFLFIFVWVEWLSSSAAPAIATTAGVQPLSTKIPPFDTGSHPIKPKMLLNTLGKPVPTNQWWTNLLISDSVGQHPGEGQVTVMPYTVKNTPRGLEVSYGDSRRVATNSSIQEFFNADLTFGLESAAPISSRSVVAHDSLSVTLLHGTSMKSFLVRGSPYITVEYTNATPTISINGTILKIDGNDTKFVFTTQNDAVVQKWNLYASKPISLSLHENNVTLTQPFTGILRAAFVPDDDEQVVDLLDRHSTVYPVAADLDFNVVNDTGFVRFNWTTRGEGDEQLLMVANPHHVETLMNSTVVLHDLPSYRTLKGKATFVIGNQWLLVETLTTVSYDSPITPDAAKSQIILESLEKDSNFTPSKNDPYFFGKEAAKQARLALIANQLGETDVREVLVNRLKNWMLPWLLGENDDSFQYEKVWGGLCSKNGLKGVFWMTDFGNGWYSDHHFHYGYLIYTLAVIGRFSPSFIDQHKEAVLAIVRDIANPSTNDPYFPFARHFSWFDGHSFASGVFVLDGGKSQESVSEAINAYYSVYLLGLSIKSKVLEDFGRILLSMEMRSAREYWQMPANSSIYEPIYAANRMTGQIASTKTVYFTWFGQLDEYMHLINMIPFTPITEEFLNQSFVQEDYNVLRQKALSRVSPAMSQEWKGYAHMAQAIIDPSAAWEAIQNLTVFDDGNSRTNALFWVATRP